MKEQLSIPAHFIGKVWFCDTPDLDYFHRHDELECNLVCRGRGSYIVGNQRIDLEPNTIFWLFPDQEHLIIDSSDDFALWILVIKPHYLQQSCIDLESQPLLQQQATEPFLRYINHQAFNRLETICHQTVATSPKVALYNAALGYLLHSCWDAYQQGSIMSLGHAVHPAIHQIAKYLLDGQYDDDLTTLAREVGLTPETVSRLFRKQTGISLAKYRNRCRLERFLALYGDGFSRVMLDAALEAGFGSYAQFYRVFCEMMHQTPAAYRRQLHR
ncbi:MAG: helix-turn-helix transcriptional regulator [Chloroflexota bacterium]